MRYPLDFPKSPINFAVPFLEWAVSSVGSEHYLDKVGVTGSNPVQPTQDVGLGNAALGLRFFLFFG